MILKIILKLSKSVYGQESYEETETYLQKYSRQEYTVFIINKVNFLNY